MKLANLSCFCSYYQLEDTSSGSVNTFLSQIVAKALEELEASYCIEIEEVGQPATLSGQSLPVDTVCRVYIERM